MSILTGGGGDNVAAWCVVRGATFLSRIRLRYMIARFYSKSSHTAPAGGQRVRVRGGRGVWKHQDPRRTVGLRLRAKNSARWALAARRWDWQRAVPPAASLRDSGSRATARFKTLHTHPPGAARAVLGVAGSYCVVSTTSMARCAPVCPSWSHRGQVPKPARKSHCKP
jgi:hypothetical protein